ncbi:hypothetical protein BJV74DRAFT_795072 [Russula compacta]|nr:hypothetical protein BJV74DRAFT_795072 [Russula compacta]
MPPPPPTYRQCIMVRTAPEFTHTQHLGHLVAVITVWEALYISSPRSSYFSLSYSPSMVSIPKDHAINIPAASRKREDEGETHEITVHQSHMNFEIISPALPASNSQYLTAKTSNTRHSQYSHRPRCDLHQSEQDDVTIHTPTQAGQGQIQAEEQTHNSGVHAPCGRGGPDDLTETQRQRLYGKEARNDDGAKIQGPEKPDGCPYLYRSKQNLQVNPSGQVVYYLEQNVAIVAQISTLLHRPAGCHSFHPPPPFPAFNPTTSDIRVDASWFMSLVFILSSAILALLVQRWVRVYMQVYQRYTPSEDFPASAILVRRIALSGIFIQKLHSWGYKDRGSDGVLKFASSNIALAKVQLAMEETGRIGGDELAIRWAIGNLTEDAEMESFVMAVPGNNHSKRESSNLRMVASDHGIISSFEYLMYITGEFLILLGNLLGPEGQKGQHTDGAVEQLTRQYH